MNVFSFENAFFMPCLLGELIDTYVKKV